MAEDIAAQLAKDGPAAPPRDNGELMFESPWESRLFGMTMALCEKGHIEWSVFQQQLIAEIGYWERTAKPDEDYHYYHHWLAALETVLKDKAFL